MRHGVSATGAPAGGVCSLRISLPSHLDSCGKRGSILVSVGDASSHLGISRTSHVLSGELDRSSRFKKRGGSVSSFARSHSQDGHSTDPLFPDCIEKDQETTGWDSVVYDSRCVGFPYGHSI